MSQPSRHCHTDNDILRGFFGSLPPPSPQNHVVAQAVVHKAAPALQQGASPPKCKPPSNTAWQRPRPSLPTPTPSATPSATERHVNGVVFDATAATTPTRRTVIPERFATIAQYVDLWSAAVEEELSLRYGANTVCGVLPHQRPCITHSLREPARTLAAAIATCSSAQSTAPHPPTPAALQRALRGYSAEASMQHGFAPGPPRLRRACHEDDDDRSSRCFLLLASGVQPASAYRKGDLWVVSNRPTLQTGGRSDWVAVVRSQWHGPSRDQGKCVW